MTEATQSIVPPEVGDQVAVAESFVRRFVPLWVWIACIVVALVAIEPALHGDAFIWTDKTLVRDNSFLNKLAGLASLWTGFVQPSTYPLPQYAPLAQTSFFLDRLIWAGHAGGFRITSALLHATVGLVLFQLLRKLNVRGAAIAAILYVAHPLTVESVAWLTERRNVLAALFGLSATYLSLRAAGTIAPPPADAKFTPLPPEPSRLYLLAAALQLLGLFASPSIALLPGVVLLVAWWKRTRFDARLIGVTAGLLLAGVVLAFVNANIERASVPTPASAWSRDATPIGDAVTRAQIAGRGVATYAARFVAPWPLLIDQPRPLTPADASVLSRRGGSAILTGGTRIGPDALLAWLAPLAVIGLLYAAWKYRSRVGDGPLVVFGAFVLLLAPSLGFISLGWMRYAFVADRAAYLAIAPLMAGAVAAAGAYAARRALLDVSFGVAALVLAGMIGVSRIGTSRFADELGFWRTTMLHNPRSLLAAEQLVAAELNRAQPDYDAIDRLIDDGLKDHPREPSLLRLNAVALLQNDKTDEAQTVIRTTLELDPNYAAAFDTLGDIFRRLATAQPNDRDLRVTSREAYKRAAELDANDWRARLGEAEANAEIMRRIGPDHPEAQALMDRSLEALDEATQLQPYRVDSLLFAARQLLQLGRIADATRRIDVARGIEPNNAEVYVLFGEAYEKSNNPQPAEASLLRAIELEPRSLRAFVRLGALRQSQERWDVARDALASALQLNPESAEARARLADVDAQRQTIWPPPVTAAPTTVPTSGATTAPATR